MDDKGRKSDVLIEDAMLTDPQTGVRAASDFYFNVWADTGLESVISAVDGVSHCMETAKSHYIVFVDRRYDMEFVKREVEAAILCRE